MPVSAEQMWGRSRQVCLRLLPPLAEVLPEAAAMSQEGQLSYLEFIRWALSNLGGGRQVLAAGGGGGGGCSGDIGHTHSCNYTSHICMHII